MEIILHPHFEKSYKKRISHNKKLVEQTKKRIQIFIQAPQSPELFDHPLAGDKLGLRAFSISGDIRITYQALSKDVVRFFDIGSHNQVY